MFRHIVHLLSVLFRQIRGQGLDADRVTRCDLCGDRVPAGDMRCDRCLSEVQW